MANPKRREWPFEKETRKTVKLLNQLLDLLGVDNLHNAVVCVQSLENKRQAADEKYENFLQEVLTATRTKRKDAALKRIAAWQKKLIPTDVPELYGLNTEFLSGIGVNWQKTAEGKDEVSMVANLQKLIEKQKEQASGIYYRFIERVGELALKYPEEERAEYVIDWHTLFVADFDEMSIPQLYQEYEGRFIGVNVLPKPVVDVSFAEALPLISNWAPKRLYQDLLETRQDLGTISKEQFIAWENAVTKKIENPAEREAQRKETMRAILSIAVYRVATQSTEGAPKPTQQNVLSSFLMTKEENPYAEEFSIAEDAGLLDFATLYHQHAGVEK